MIVVDSQAEAVEEADKLADEYVEILTVDPDYFLRNMNYGAMFPGPKTNFAYGDKVIGTTHILPTRGADKFTEVCGLESFLKLVHINVVRKRQAL